MASTTEPERMQEASPAPEKTKRRWTREEKKALRANKRHESANDNGSSTMSVKPKKLKKIPLSPFERLLQCADQAGSTGSVQVKQLKKSKDCNIDISTYCRREPTAMSLSPSTTHVIYVQPLLILDLNGILCHRIRHKRGSNYRPSTARIANTPIVPRVDLQDFLTFLDANFCLAVWTSAKPKTAKQIVSLLFPEEIQQRLLFLWAQSKCHAIPRETRSDKKPLFQKPLSHVWQHYPLWDAGNTFMLDDSPKKCGMEYSTNTLHPPPLHGQHHFLHDSNEYRQMSDLENEQRQLQFFQQLVDEVDRNDGNVLDFFERHGRGHMGWRGPSERESDDSCNGGDIES